MPLHYHGFGLRIESDFVIPGAIDWSQAGTPSDLKISLGTTRLGPDAKVCAPYRRLDGKLELIVPGIASFLLESPGQLTVVPEASAKDEDVSALLIASGIPMALWARGGLLLHASGVIQPGEAQAIAIAGASGSGKSSLARMLVTHGSKLIADDSLWLREQHGELTVSGLPGGLFAPNNAARAERTFWPVAAGAQSQAAQLGAIVILDPSLPPAAPLQLRGADALAALLRHRHRPRIPALLGIEAERLAFTALLCAQVPVYALGGEPEANAERLEHICGLTVTGP
jgi:hypothetical protein